ncbi:MAG: hypothetical protein QMC83_07905 [Thermodesulfovibrionales bacterium]|nr:hypothetical protein [Thermodesulfovibrionales bacterium]
MIIKLTLDTMLMDKRFAANSAFYLLGIVKVTALIDRQEGGREAVEAEGYKVESIITRDEVMNRYLKRDT